MTDKPKYMALNLTWPSEVVVANFRGNEKAVVRKTKNMLATQTGLKLSEIRAKGWWNDEGDYRTLAYGWILDGQGD